MPDAAEAVLARIRLMRERSRGIRLNGVSATRSIRLHMCMRFNP
jgi:hypothetical protein